MTRMLLRAVLLGVLSLSVVSCKSHDEATKSQPGVAAGKVIEASGTVTVHHGDAAKPLAKGDSLEGDDIVETGADGHVLIELAHNNATWDLGPNKKTKLRESVAWALAKQDKAAKAVEQDSAAAGRHAERNAADTTVSAGAPSPASAAPDVEPAKAEVETARADEAPKVERKHESEKKAAPPPPPAVQPKADSASNAPAAPPKIAAPHSLAPGAGAKDIVGDVGGGEGTAAAKMVPPAASTLVHEKDAQLKACLAGADQAGVTIQVDAAGKATIVFSGTVGAKVQSCIKGVVKTIHFPKAQAKLSFVIKP